LAGYYVGAFALVYPSKYEGFGLPPIEAMSLGCPVIASTSPPMPEVIGTAGVYIDPESVGSIMMGLSELNNIDFRNTLINKGYDRVALFTWELASEKALRFYQWLIASKDK
jgi:glycosyltransferase involved in cell wall biosynthesis